jgi:hypothetical protein
VVLPTAVRPDTIMCCRPSPTGDVALDNQLTPDTASCSASLLVLGASKLRPA